MLNKILEAKPEDMVITMHICRGNFRSTWSSTGGYEPVAEILFGHCNVDGFFLEYDSDRAGGFEPLRYIGKQKVVLGLVTSKDAKLENKEDVIARIREASKYVPLEQLGGSARSAASLPPRKATLSPMRISGASWRSSRRLQKKSGPIKQQDSLKSREHGNRQTSAPVFG